MFYEGKTVQLTSYILIKLVGHFKITIWKQEFLCMEFVVSALFENSGSSPGRIQLC